MTRWWIAVLFIFLVQVGQGQQMLPGELIVKVKPSHSGVLDRELPADLQTISENYGPFAISNVFPPIAEAEESSVHLENIYSLEYPGNYPPSKLAKILERLDWLEYVEPRYIGELALSPNDPQFGSQFYLQAIGAEQAWDSTTGSSSIVIALLDAGVDTAHEDFGQKFWKNTADPIDGTDNDNDGFVDNYDGWDFYTNTNYVLYTTTSHGLQMSGAIAPATNNSKGVAGIGYNSTMLPVKVTDGNSQVVYAYEGIKYAADKGCQIINCSWNIGVFSAFGLDVVTYATVDKGALVVAAMGNNSKESANYPAMFPYVLGVSAVDNNGFKVSQSNFGYQTGLSAPGLNILTTKENNGYATNSGTSLSSAIVSGAAALIKAKHSNLGPQEISAYLKASSKNIYANGQNGQYLGKLGVGMLHAGQALAYDGSAFPELIAFKAFDPENGVIESGDTVSIQIDLANYLANSAAVTAVLSAENLNSTVVQANSNWASIAKNDSVDNQGQLFEVAISNQAGQNESLDFSLILVEDGDTSNWGLSITVNTAYQLIQTSQIETSLGNRGTFGWYLYPQKEGNGFLYQGSQLLYEGGLMIGQKSTDLVVDRIRGIRNVEQTDFNTLQSLSRELNGAIPFELKGSFTDSGSSNEIGLNIEQLAFAWPGVTSRENLVILKYVIRSKDGSRIDDLAAGLLADWDIENLDKNRAEYDDFHFLAYTHSTENKGPYCGVQLLTLVNRQKVYSIDHIAGGGGGVDLTDNDVFSKSEKLTTLTQIRKQAGQQSGGNDVLQVIGSGPYDVQAGDSLVIAFALMVADDLPSLQEVADTAFWLYNNRVPDNINEYGVENELEIFPNPSKEVVNLRWSQQFNAQIELYSIWGKLVFQKFVEGEGSLQINTSELPTGTYYLRVIEGDKIHNKTLIKN